MKMKSSIITKLLRSYIYIAMSIKLYFVIMQFIETKQINYLLGELVAWTIILVSPITDYFIEKGDIDVKKK